MALAIGIDLGTTNSVAAVATKRGVRIAVGEGSERVHPSVVSFPGEGGVVVGEEAKQRRAIDPASTIYSAKRLIGQNMRAPLVELALSSMPFRVEEGVNQQPIVLVRGRRMTVPEISGLVLSHLKRMAEKQFGDEIAGAVITVPANFSDAQRQATKEAGAIAGLEVLRLVNEPTAAALAYGYGRRLDDLVAVFDFGGGTFDVSILRIRGEIFEVLATGGDFFLGGDDLDRALAEHLAAELNRKHGVDARNAPEAMTRLSLAAEQIKCYLSNESVAGGEIDGIVVGSETMTLPFEISRRTFESMISGYVDKTIDVCQQVMTAAKLEPRQIGAVILVGGSTRIPIVRQRVADVFGCEPATRINPDEVVAYGAAIQASMLSSTYADVPADSPAAHADTGATPGGETRVDPRAATIAAPGAAPGAAPSAGPVFAAETIDGIEPPRVLLLDVTPAALSIATVGGYSEKLLDKNSPIPIERTRVFTTGHDRQTRVVIDCCRGEERRFAENEPLGSVVLDGVPPGPRGDAKVEVTFRVDADGILHVRARDVRTGNKQEAKLNVLGAPVAPGSGSDLPVSARR